MNKIFIITVVFYIFTSVTLCENVSEQDNDEFIPTHKWQVIREGQKIPKGLHVRINIEKGVKEGKLIKYKNRNALVSKIYKDDIMDNMKVDFKNDQPVRNTYNGILRIEITKLLLNKLKCATLKDEILKVTKDLEFLAHNYVYATDFIRLDGFDGIIYKNLNSTDEDVIINTLRLITAMTQNYDILKTYALESGALSVLIRILEFQKNISIQKSAVITLGSILRSYPEAQMKFINNGGLTVFSKVFTKDNLKLQIKLATVISDIINDFKWGPLDYKDFNMEDYVIEENWCENFNFLLVNLVSVDTTDIDSVEKCLVGMNLLIRKCAVKYNKEVLTKLQIIYQPMVVKEFYFGGSLFTNLNKLLKNIIQHINLITNKTEL